MRYLILESVSLKPHLETAGEIALQARSDGHDVTYAWLGRELPWSDWALPVIARWLGCSLEKRETRFEELLNANGVNVLKIEPDDQEWYQELVDWTQSFNGGLEELKNFSYKNTVLGSGVASSLISYTGNSCYDPQADIDRVRACLGAALLVYLRAKRIICANKPDVVVTFNGRFATSKPIVCAAEALGIKVLRHERGFSHTHYELFSEPIHCFDYIRRRIEDAWALGKQDVREELGHNFYKLRRRGDGIGWYSFTTRQRKGHVVGRISCKRRLVYFTSSDDEYAAVADVNKPGPWIDQLAAVNDLISVTKPYTDLELIIRVHPHLVKKSSYEVARWMALEERGVTVIRPDALEDSYELMDSADIVASYGSTIGMEAAYAGKPSILLGPSAYSESGAVYKPLSKIELGQLLDSRNHLAAPSQSLCLPYGYYYMSYGRQFRYYEPTSLAEGCFLGDRLGWDNRLVLALRKLGVGTLYHAVRNYMKK